MNHYSLFLKKISLTFLASVLFFQGGCAAEEEKIPQYKSLYEYDSGCSFTFEINGRLSHLTIASAGDVFFESHEKKIGTEIKNLKIEARKMNNNSYLISIINAKTKNKTSVGIIPPEGWAELNSACPSVMRLVDTQGL